MSLHQEGTLAVSDGSDGPGMARHGTAVAHGHNARPTTPVCLARPPRREVLCRAHGVPGAVLTARLRPVATGRS
jgi:hypothetical protein